MQILNQRDLSPRNTGHSKFEGTRAVVSQTFGRPSRTGEYTVPPSRLYLSGVIPCVYWAIQSSGDATKRGKENAPAAEPPERSKFILPRLADLRAQEAAVIFDSHSTAAE